jgi:hypothetical protein
MGININRKGASNQRLEGEKECVKQKSNADL